MFYTCYCIHLIYYRPKSILHYSHKSLGLVLMSFRSLIFMCLTKKHHLLNMWHSDHLIAHNYLHQYLDNTQGYIYRCSPTVWHLLCSLYILQSSIMPYNQCCTEIIYFHPRNTLHYIRKSLGAILTSFRRCLFMYRTTNPRELNK